MAIKLNGNTAIDDSRSLINVSSITFADSTTQTSAATGISAAEALANVAAINFSDGKTLDPTNKIFSTAHNLGDLIATLVNPITSTAGVSFGSQIAFSGTYLIVSAPGNRDSNNNNFAGIIYVFDLAAESLLYTIEDPAAYGTPVYDEFGIRLAVSGDILVGVSLNESSSSGAYYAGKAYVIDLTTGNILYNLESPTPTNYEEFGWGVAVTGNYIALSSPYTSASSGAVYVYNASTGSLLYTLNSPENIPSFGRFLAAYGTRLAVSAVPESGLGYVPAVYIYDITTQQVIYTLVDPEGLDNQSFGNSIAITDTYIAIGSHYSADAGGSGSGKVHIYSATTGSLLYTINNPNYYGTSAEDVFGKTVAMNSTHIIISSYEQDLTTGDAYAGVGYLYELSSGNLVHVFQDPNIVSTPQEDFFTSAVAITDNYIAIGADWEKNYTLDRRIGVTYLYAAKDQSYFDKLATLVNN